MHTLFRTPVVVSAGSWALTRTLSSLQLEAREEYAAWRTRAAIGLVPEHLL